MFIYFVLELSIRKFDSFSLIFGLYHIHQIQRQNEILIFLYIFQCVFFTVVSKVILTCNFYETYLLRRNAHFLLNIFQFVPFKFNKEHFLFNSLYNAIQTLVGDIYRANYSVQTHKYQLILYSRPTNTLNLPSRIQQFQIWIIISQEFFFLFYIVSKNFRQLSPWLRILWYTPANNICIYALTKVHFTWICENVQKVIKLFVCMQWKRSSATS